MRKYCQLICIPIILLLLPCHAAGAPISANIPLDSWIYPALDKLSGLNIIDTGLHGTRPYTRLEVAHRIKAGIERTKQESTSILPIAREVLSHLEREFHDELIHLQGRASSYFKPLRELRLDYVYQDGPPSRMPLHLSEAEQFSVNYNNDGIDYAENHNLQITFKADARLGSSLLFDVRPLIMFREGMDEDPSLEILTGEAAVGLGPFQISLGRQSLWWGQGRHGNLILTNNAKPLDMARITNPVPATLPWLLRYLGPFRFELFFSRLEEDRFVPEPYFTGLRLNIKPFSWMEIGASRVIMFGGKGRPALDVGDYLIILTGENLSGDDDTSNQLAAIDISLRLPFLWNAQIYGETGGEDESGHFITLIGWVAGLYLPIVEPSGRLSLRIEFADLAFSGYRTGGPWYAHGLYRSGYTHERKIMGHHVGSTAKDYFAGIEFHLNKALNLRLSTNYEIRGYDEPHLETHMQGAFLMDWLLRDNISVGLNYRFDKVNAYNFTPGDNRFLHFASIGLKCN